MRAPRCLLPALAGLLLGEARGVEPAPTPSRPVREVRAVTPAQAQLATMLAQRTISGSKQFLIFCPDAAIRSRVASFTEETKKQLLELLGQPDGWKNQILITLAKAAPDAPDAPAELTLFQNEAGFKIQIDVRVGEDPARVNLQKHIVRALLLELAYRDHPERLRAGTAFSEAPWWIVEGMIQLIQHREGGPDTDLFKRIVDVNRLPPLGKFLAGHPSDFNGTAVETMDQACAMCLVQLLIEQPSGREALTNFIRHWPDGNGDGVAALTKEFSGLGADEKSLQKWWTLNLARFSVADRYKGLNSEETEAALAPLLQIEVAADDGKSRETYPLADFPKFIKLKAARPALAAAGNAVAGLSVRGSALYRPVIAEYGEILGLLARGKTWGLKSRLAKIEQLRDDLHKRTTAISDYLNWFQATQMEVRSDSFAGYLRAADELDHPAPRTDPISRYLDAIAELPTPHPSRPPGPAK